MKRPRRLAVPMPRPEKKKGERKDLLLHIRVTEEQKRAFEAAATRTGMDVSTFARVCMLEKARAAGIKI
jgi:uncharacterized protein (DUF1778 family)